MVVPLRAGPSGPLAAGGSTWADVLAAGNETLGNTPAISPGDGLYFESDNSITVAGGSLDFDVDVDLTLTVGNDLDETITGNYFVSIGAIYSLFAEGDVEIFTNNGTLWLDAGNPGDLTGLIRLEAPLVEVNSPDMTFTSDLAVTIGQSDYSGAGGAPGIDIVAASHLGVTAGSNGGNLELRAGEGGVNATGGGVLLSPGGGNTNGSINIVNGSGNTMILIDGDNTAIGGSQPIYITTAGLSFWDGTPAMKPTCTTELEAVEALGAMGLIDWAPP